MYKFTNFPSALSPHFYQDQKQSFLFDIAQHYDIDTYAVYTIGEEELLGVSDIDFLIISNNIACQQEILTHHKKYFLIDRPFFIREEDLINLPYFSHHTNYIHVGGKNLLPGKKPIVSHELSLIYSWKILYCGCLRNFYIPYFSKVIPVKDMLCWIFDLRYPITYAQQLGYVSADTINWLDQFTHFRKNWFSHQDTTELAAHLEIAISITWQLIQYLDKQFDLPMHTSSYYSKTGRYPTIFRTLPTIQDHQAATQRYYTRFGLRDRFLDLPVSFYHKLWGPNLQKELKKILNIHPDYLTFGFDKRRLNLLLLCKKIYNSITLGLFLYHEKA